MISSSMSPIFLYQTPIWSLMSDRMFDSTTESKPISDTCLYSETCCFYDVLGNGKFVLSAVQVKTLVSSLTPFSLSPYPINQ